MEGYKKKILWNYQTGNYIILTDGDIKNKRRKDMKKRSSVIISIVLLFGIIFTLVSCEYNGNETDEPFENIDPNIPS